MANFPIPRMHFVQRGHVPFGWISPVQWQPGQRVAVRGRSAFVRGVHGVAEFIRIDRQDVYEEPNSRPIVIASNSVWRDPFGREFRSVRSAVEAWPDRPAH
jgi:hypothetical protein